MKRGLTGHYVPLPSAAGENARAFVPNPLPPAPPLELDTEIQELIQNAMLALGRLDGLTTVLPEPAIFLYSYVRKEAVLSSQIEGTQSSLSDLLLFEMEGVAGVPLDDVQEVSNYVAAMNYGLKRLEKLPLSLRLLKEIHGVLMRKGRGSKKEPGEFRRSQNWVGGTRPGNALFVPPPPDLVLECLGALEKFLHNDPVKTLLLIKAALAHVQFETIHPFLDGNGRLGRLLITFLFCAEGALREPLLYLSLYFKQHRQQYYDLLQSVRLSGDWETKYGHPIFLLETFVERDRFRGTVYRAANWVRVGQTKGRTRQDRPDGTCHQAAIKDVYLYPLHRRFRRHLQAQPTPSAPTYDHHDSSNDHHRSTFTPGSAGADA